VVSQRIVNVCHDRAQNGSPFFFLQRQHLGHGRPGEAGITRLRPGLLAIFGWLITSFRYSAKARREEIEKHHDDDEQEGTRGF
jgi:hypothetical protein